MSLFEDSRYQWRETYFVVFPRSRRPDHRSTTELLQRLAGDYEVTNQRLDAQGRIESFTLISTANAAAMDICYLAGPDVTEQIEQFIREMSGQPLAASDQQRVDELRNCDARFEIFHFQRCEPTASAEDDNEEWLDPTALFDVMRILSDACGGIGMDPQSGTFVG